MVRIADHAGRIPVTTQIHQDDGERLREFFCHGVPHEVRLRVTVKQQQRTAPTAAQGVQMAGRAFYLLRLETAKHKLWPG